MIGILLAVVFLFGLMLLLAVIGEAAMLIQNKQFKKELQEYAEEQKNGGSDKKVS